jgi:uncharacterized protein YdaU (DUF1376 family)
VHYYKRNIGDYSKKAGRLSILQHGVYTLLLDACYDRERFPTREEAIDWVWAGTPEEIQAVDFVLSKFFVLQDGVYQQKRIAEELEEYRLFCEQQAQKGKAGGRPKKPGGLPAGSTENPVESHCKANESLTTNHYPLTTNQDLNSCAEPSSTPSITLTLNDKTEFPIFDHQIAEWQELYPAADVRQELRNMRGWLLANPKKRKTRTGILRFVTSWLAKEQNRGGKHATDNSTPKLNAFDRSKQKLAEWERERVGNVIDGQVVATHD